MYENARKECKRAGLIWVGDVVVGDEGNVGRLVWKGSYLIVSIFFAFFSEIEFIFLLLLGS